MALSSNDRSIAGFTMVSHGLVHWFETAIPIFLVVWLREFDVSLALLGVVIAIGYAPFGLGALPGGILADRYGPRRLVLVSLAGMSASFLFLAMATSLPGIAVALLIWGIAASCYHPAGLSLISTGVEERGRVFGWHGIAGNVGLALGPLVAATLLTLGVEWSIVAGVLALPGLAALAYGLNSEFDVLAAVGDLETTPPASLADLLADSRALFVSVFAVVFLVVTAEGLFYRGMLTYLPEILEGLPAMGARSPGGDLEGVDPSQFLYVGLLVVGMAGQYVGGRLTSHLSAPRGLFVLFAALALCALAFVPVTAMGLWAIALLCGGFGFLLFAIQPFYQNAVAVYTPPEGRGLSYGYTYLGEFGLGSASVVIGGVVLAGSSTGFFVVMAAIAVAGALLSLVLFSVADAR